MERIEENQSRPVHVLRHRFEPSPKIIPEIKSFLNPQAREEKFRVVATKMAILDGANFAGSRYDDAIRTVSENFENRTAATLLSGRVNFLEKQGQTRIRFQVKNQLAFNALLSGFNSLDSLRPDGYSKLHPSGRYVQHYLYTEVPTSALIEDKEELADVTDHFAKTIQALGTQSLYALRPLEIVGQDYMITYGEAEVKIAEKGRRIEPWLQDGIAS